MAGARGFTPELAARAASVYFISITVGRFITGILTAKLSGRILVRLGAVFAAAGLILLLLPLGGIWGYIALSCIGLGCAPIFPSMLHKTPERFGRRDAPRVMGVQMAAAYAGSVVLPPVIGFIAARAGVFVIPALILVFVALIVILSEQVDRTTARHGAK